MSKTLRMVVYDSAIEAEFLPGGDVSSAVHKWTQTVQMLARGYAPKRTGYMAANIKTEYAHTQKFGITGRVVGRAHYTKYVNSGTGPVIFPHGRYLSVPASRGSTVRVHRSSVRGQRPQLFMERALETGMARYI